MQNGLRLGHIQRLWRSVAADLRYGRFNTVTVSSSFPRDVSYMRPLQHQKPRLHEAKRLMVSEFLDTTTAAIEVGMKANSNYREYARLYGQRPAATYSLCSPGESSVYFRFAYDSERFAPTALRASNA